MIEFNQDLCSVVSSYLKDFSKVSISVSSAAVDIYVIYMSMDCPRCKVWNNGKVFYWRNKDLFCYPVINTFTCPFCEYCVIIEENLKILNSVLSLMPIVKER